MEGAALAALGSAALRSFASHVALVSDASALSESKEQATFKHSGWT